MKPLKIIPTWKTTNWETFNLCVTKGSIFCWWSSWCLYPKAGREFNQPELWKWIKAYSVRNFFSIKDHISWGTNPVDVFFQLHQNICTITTITHKYYTTRMVQEMNFPDVKYCQNNWEKISKWSDMAYYWWGFMMIKIYITGNLVRCDLRLS